MGLYNNASLAVRSHHLAEGCVCLEHFQNTGLGLLRRISTFTLQFGPCACLTSGSPVGFQQCQRLIAGFGQPTPRTGAQTINKTLAFPRASKTPLFGDEQASVNSFKNRLCRLRNILFVSTRCPSTLRCWLSISSGPNPCKR